MRRNAFIAVALVAASSFFIGQTLTVHGVQRPAGGTPTFQLDASWPRVPEKWKLGNTVSVAVDPQDHVWVLHRPRTVSEADRSRAAPPVLEFDAAGNFIQAWGGASSGYEWPE